MNTEILKRIRLLQLTTNRDFEIINIVTELNPTLQKEKIIAMCNKIKNEIIH